MTQNRDFGTRSTLPHADFQEQIKTSFHFSESGLSGVAFLWQLDISSHICKDLSGGFAKVLYLCGVAATGCGLVPAQAAAAGNYNVLWEARYDDLVMGQEHWGFPKIGVPLNHQF